MARTSERAVTARRVESALREALAAGRWQVGEALPGRRALAAEFGVALGTLQQAIAGLLREGVLAADDRRGTFVATALTSADPPRRASRPVRLGVLALIDEALGTSEGNWGYWVLKSIEREAARHAAILSLASSADPCAGMAEALAAGADCVAVVVMQHPCPEAPLLSALALAVDRAVPVAMVTDRRGRYPVTTLRSDEWHGGYLAAQHLLANGYARVAFVAPHGDSWVAERAAGAAAAAEQLGSSVGLCLSAGEAVGYGAFLALDREAQMATMARLLSPYLADAETPLGLICPTDYDAELAWTVCADLGRQVGSEVGVLGFDGSPLARRLGLTSLRQPIEELGEAAARALLRAVEGEAMPTTLPLAYHLVPRGSTAPGA